MDIPTNTLTNIIMARNMNMSMNTIMARGMNTLTNIITGKNMNISMNTIMAKNMNIITEKDRDIPMSIRTDMCIGA